MKRAVMLLVVTSTVLALGGVAAAKPSPQRKAQSIAEGLIQSYLPSAPGQSGICDTKTQEGLFDKNKMYFASCATADGSLQIFAIVNASKGGLDTGSSYLLDRLVDLCGGKGAAFVAAVKGKFALIFTGTGDASSFGSAASIAQGLSGMLANQIKNVPGEVSAQACPPRGT
jgi:hypothetical protein